MTAPSTILAASTALLVLLAAQGALGCRVRRTLLQAPMGLEAVDLKSCPAVEAGSTAPPSGSRELWSAPINGTRNYTCIAGKPVGDGATIYYHGDQEGGVGYYTLPMPGETVGRLGYGVADVKAGLYWFDTAKNSTAPSPTGGLPDARWPTSYRSSGAQPCDYFVRTNTTGGATPTDCGSTPEGGEILIPFTATITCYACK
ncbi:hypothetical protein ABPG77_004596 [Micractinium sp. CCAP 211/92]